MASMMLVAHRAGAQTPQQLQQMEYERQQREYWRQQEQQRLEQQRQQQIWEENARRQQEESRRSNVPIGSGASPAMPGGAPPVGGAYQGGAQAAELEKARQIWLRRPALAADHNPLLGKWMRPRSTRGNSSDPFAQLGALLKGGACEVFFGGGGVFEFRPDRMVGSDAQTKEMELDRVEYRGDAKRVVVIPKTTLRLIVFDFEGPNRINWAGQDCELVRVGAGRTAAAPSPIQAAAPATAARANAGGAVLKLTAGFSSDGGAFSPLAGSKFIVLRHSVDVALASRGYRPPPGVSVYQGWVTACQARAPGCAQGLQGVKSDALGVLQTDPQGIARTQPISAGTYYLFGSARRGAQGMMWNVRVDLKPGDNAVTLDQRNAVALN
ncbi:MAG: hypothetical protein ACM3PU_13045 [Gemmatimonadota bacterium]